MPILGFGSDSLNEKLLSGFSISSMHKLLFRHLFKRISRSLKENLRMPKFNNAILGLGSAGIKKKCSNDFF